MSRTLAFLLPLALVACGGGSQSTRPAAGPATPPAQPVAEKPTELHVYIWTNYHSAKAIADFEKEFNAKVVIDTYDNNEVIEQKLQSGTAPYDIVVPSDYMVTSLARQNLLVELDPARLPGLDAIDPQLDWEKALGGARHCVPYLWSTTGFAYRTDKVAEVLDSWAGLFDEKYKGRVVMLDDMREAFAAALKADGKSLNSVDKAELDAAKDRLVKQRKLILAYDSSDFAGKIQAGDGWVVHGYSGELARVARDSAGAIKYVVPKEGATLAVDSLAIPTAAKNKDLAYKFLAFMLRVENAAETTNATGYPTANAKARPLIKPELASDPAVFPPMDSLTKCETMKDLGETTATLDELWTEIKAH